MRGMSTACNERHGLYQIACAAKSRRGHDFPSGDRRRVFGCGTAKSQKRTVPARGRVAREATSRPARTLPCAPAPMTIALLHDDGVLAHEADQQWISDATFGRYEAIREIGRGGMSRVLLAWDRTAGRNVALKLLAHGAAASVADRERFRREALITAQANHPHIVPCFEFVCRGAQAMAVMRYVPGDSLADRLAGGARLDPAALLAILVPIADALAHVHARGVVHRDVKPGNILLHADDGWPFLTDFGVATLRTSDRSRWEATQRMGTPEFMSPEQALG